MDFFIKLGRHVYHGERMNPIDFGGQRSKVKVTMDIYGIKLLTHGNLILQKPFLHFRARLKCDVELNCLCHVVDHT